MKELYNTLSLKIQRCIGEVRKVDDEMIKLRERRECYNDRKLMLEELRDKFKGETENETD